MEGCKELVALGAGEAIRLAEPLLPKQRPLNATRQKRKAARQRHQLSTIPLLAPEIFRHLVYAAVGCYHRAVGCNPPVEPLSRHFPAPCRVLTM